MTVSQLVIAALVGVLSVVAWAQSSSGELFLLAVTTFSVQLVSAAWTASGTANDRIDAAEKTIVRSGIKPRLHKPASCCWNQMHLTRDPVSIMNSVICWKRARAH